VPSSTVRVANLRALAVLLDELPRLVYRARQHQRVSQRTLARELGLSQNTIANFEAGQGVNTTTQRIIIGWLADVHVEYPR
jgi:transcriptional regulator with XRE-family HTH domain